MDSNGAIQLDGYVSNNTVNLSWNEEPVNDGDNDPSTNLTDCFGHPDAGNPNRKRVGLILMSLMLMLAGVYWHAAKLDRSEEGMASTGLPPFLSEGNYSDETHTLPQRIGHSRTYC